MIPRAMLDVMNILKEASKGTHPPEFLATHPLPETRLDQIQAEIKEAYPNGIPSNLTKGRALRQPVVVERIGSRPFVTDAQPPCSSRSSPSR